MLSSSRVARQHARRRAAALAALSTVGVLFAAATSPGLAVASSGPAAADETSTGQRVLQSVAVAMRPDGTFTSVEGTTVSRGDGSDDEAAVTHDYAPQDVVGDLPVRVLTAYRTDEGAGTDLAELSGYTGRVEIDLTVQNLTMTPKTLEYDVDGSSRSRSALVGAPLTVVASAVLDGADASSIVTPSDKSTAPSTNGVLSQASDGTPQVQWATILAPPQIGPTATLSLVVDAKDFDPPAFDLSVQPGLVTDPSVGALVDAAFQPGDSSERKLQARTIELVGEVNTVLAKAGQTISRVRTNLDASAETLGTKTIGDLGSSATGVASSMKSLDGSVKSLGSDLSSSLESTRSSAVQQLLQTVTALDQMLGDTSVKPQPAAVRGQGCATSVAAPGGASSVYGNLVRVAGQLSGFANATASCRSALQQSILDSVGPAEPDDESCADDDSVTCALYGARTSFGAIAEDLVKSGDDALTALEPASVDDAVAAAEALSDQVDAVAVASGELGDAEPGGGGFGHLDLRPVTAAIVAAGKGVNDVEAKLGDIRGVAQSAAGQVSSMSQQNLSLAQQLCDLAGDGSLDPTKAEALRAQLVATNCDGSANQPASDGTMAALIDDQSASWATVLTLSDTSSGETAAALGELRARIAAVQTAVETLADAAGQEGSVVGGKVKGLQKAMKSLLVARTTVTSQVQKVKEQQATAIAGVKEAFRQAASDASDNVSDTVDPQIRQVTAKSQLSRDELGKMFTRSAAGLDAAAGKITQDGAATLEKQKKSFAREQEAAGDRISQQVQQGLAGIASGVSSSTRDMEAASALLSQDLHRVLLDLGDRKVNGSGLLGAMTTGAATARSADYQLALATDTATSYANVRSADIGGLLLRQAQSDASLQMAAALPAFGIELPSGADHRTVYTFHIGSGS
jgi:trimeric autotransporter adhesin